MFAFPGIDRLGGDGAKVGGAVAGGGAALGASVVAGGALGTGEGGGGALGTAVGANEVGLPVGAQVGASSVSIIVAHAPLSPGAPTTIALPTIDISPKRLMSGSRYSFHSDVVCLPLRSPAAHIFGLLTEHCAGRYAGGSVRADSEGMGAVVSTISAQPHRVPPLSWMTIDRPAMLAECG